MGIVEMDIESIVEFLEKYNYWASYIGLGLSIFIIWKSNSIQNELSKFKDEFIFKKRLPKILNEMDKKLKETNSLLNKNADNVDMKSHLNTYIDMLRGLEDNNKFNNDLKDRIRKTKDNIEKFMKDEINGEVTKLKDSLNDIYFNLKRLKLENEEI